MKNTIKLSFLITVIGCLITTCDTNSASTESNPCKCPNGTAHEWNETCCVGKDNCHCTIKPRPCEHYQLKVGEAGCGFFECNCAPKVYGVLSTGSGDSEIKICVTIGVTDEELESNNTIQNIIDAYNNLEEYYGSEAETIRELLPSKVDMIIVIPNYFSSTRVYYEDAKGLNVFGFKSSRTTTGIMSWLRSLAIGNTDSIFTTEIPQFDLAPACYNDPAVEHTFGDWSYIYTNCNEGGIHRRTCSVCFYQENEAAPIREHSFGSWVITVAATCINEGSQCRSCSVCYYQENEAAAIDLVTGHLFDYWAIFKTVIPATCIATGTETSACLRDGCTTETPTRPTAIDPKGHNVISSTPVSTGIEIGTCQLCNEADKLKFTLEPGDTGPAGGFIFYVADGKSGRPLGFTLYMDANDTVGTNAYYLEAAQENLGPMMWSTVTGPPDLKDISNEAIGAGKKNTALILEGDQEFPAALACVDYGNGKAYDDWFLPSRNELYAFIGYFENPDIMDGSQRRCDAIGQLIDLTDDCYLFWSSSGVPLSETIYWVRVIGSSSYNDYSRNIIVSSILGHYYFDVYRTIYYLGYVRPIRAF